MFFLFFPYYFFSTFSLLLIPLSRTCRSPFSLSLSTALLARALRRWLGGSAALLSDLLRPCAPPQAPPQPCALLRRRRAATPSRGSAAPLAASAPVVLSHGPHPPSPVTTLEEAESEGKDNMRDVRSQRSRLELHFCGFSFTKSLQRVQISGLTIGAGCLHLVWEGSGRSPSWSCAWSHAKRCQTDFGVEAHPFLFIFDGESPAAQ